MFIFTWIYLHWFHNFHGFDPVNHYSHEPLALCVEWFGFRWRVLWMYLHEMPFFSSSCRNVFVRIFWHSKSHSLFIITLKLIIVVISAANHLSKYLFSHPEQWAMPTQQKTTICLNIADHRMGIKRFINFIYGTFQNYFSSFGVGMSFGSDFFLRGMEFCSYNYF